MKVLARFPSRIVAALAFTTAALAGPAAASADTPAPAVWVEMTDTGFAPAAVTIPVGGMVTWKNDGGVTHTASSLGGAPATFNTAGVGPGETASVTFAVPGQYFYTSATDCLNNNNIPPFPCTISYLVTVLPAGASVAPTATPAAQPTPTLAPSSAQAGPQANATMVITDGGISPSSVTVGLNGAVTFVNKGTNVHTATTNADVITNGLPPFDTGGLGPGQTSSIGLTAPGTYTFTSSPDCVSKSNPGAFNCGPYSVTVLPTAAGSPQGSQAPGPAATPVNVQGATVSVAIDDSKGFQPQNVTIKAGQTVGWLNVGNNSHSVVVNTNPTPNSPVPWWLPYQLPTNGSSFFDSGGIGPQQSFLYQFTTSGVYPYHSSTEPVYLVNNTNCSCTLVTYQFFGSVTVTP
jgi:plastocyanin